MLYTTIKESNNNVLRRRGLLSRTIIRPALANGCCSIVVHLHSSTSQTSVVCNKKCGTQQWKKAKVLANGCSGIVIVHLHLSTSLPSDHVMAMLVYNANEVVTQYTTQYNAVCVQEILCSTTGKYSILSCNGFQPATLLSPFSDNHQGDLRPHTHFYILWRQFLAGMCNCAILPFLWQNSFAAKFAVFP